MRHALDYPLITAPDTWTLVFSREARTWWASWLALGRYKHVRAYAYVPFLHVWVFYDVHLRGTDLIVAADGEPAQRMIALWMVKADLLRVRRVDFRDHQVGRENRHCLPLLGFCVPAIRRLLGIPGSALRPDTLYRHCLKHGALPFEAVDGCPGIQTAAP